MVADELAQVLAAAGVDETLDNIGNGGFIAAALGMVALVAKMLLNRANAEADQAAGWRLLVEAQQQQIDLLKVQLSEKDAEIRELRTSLRAIDERRRKRDE